MIRSITVCIQVRYYHLIHDIQKYSVHHINKDLSGHVVKRKTNCFQTKINTNHDF